ncbi:MAG TPA: putative glycoside hydrolase [Polyangiaceae bacterium]
MAPTSGPAEGAPQPGPLAPAPVTATPPASEAESPRARLIAWLKERMPDGGEIVDSSKDAVGITHRVRPGDSLAKIVDSYLDLTDVYLARDLSRAIQKENGLNGLLPKAGEKIVIPAVVQTEPKSADEERLGWPDDQVLRGLYVRGPTAGGANFGGLLERMSERGLNLIVLDSKDYDGFVTYRTKVPIAVETGAAKNAPIRDLARTIRFAHAKGIRVAIRLSCFEDEFIAKAKPNLAVQSKWRRPYPIGWLDPANPDAQAYLFDLAKEAMDAGADEIQLDYVRYPVLGIKNADFDLTKGKVPKTIVIRDFVRKMHELTQARKVPLSLDIFGIVAEGHRNDIEMLGQDPPLLAPECEALSPMVYPSHYRSGYQGFEIPGNHPEIVGIGTKKVLQQLKKVRSGTIVRPWLQAVSFNSPDYGPPYLAAEIKHATDAGATGWLMWNPAQGYSVTWRAVPVASSRKTSEPRAGPSDTATASPAGSDTVTNRTAVR